MKTNKLTLCALISAAALISFIIEAQIPPLTPIAGIKLGISNVFTLFALYTLGTKEAAAVLAVRVIVGNLITGQMMSLIYSFCGGLLAFAAMIFFKHFLSKKQIWAVSAIGGIFHNIGQIAVALLVTQTPQIIYYLPLLIISGILTGIFTGICAGLIIQRLDKTSIG